MTFEKLVKVIAYITCGDKLLVFRHSHFPQAGIQVPGGMLEGKENTWEAVLREAREETGLERLEILGYLGCDELRVDGGSPIRRHFTLIHFDGKPQPNWRHEELIPSDGTPGPIEFEFYWVRLDDAQSLLSGNQGAMLTKLAVDASGDIVALESANGRAFRKGPEIT